MTNNHKEVYAAATEDMDTLTFQSPILLRNLTASEAKKKPILEFNHNTLLTEMGLTQNEV